MNQSIPITKRESETLELKSLAALAEPEKIGRGAVAMLNSRGGSIWIGIREGAVTNEVEPIYEAAEAERARRRLQDHLLDVIEPAPLGSELSVIAEPLESETGAGGRVLRVALQPGAGRGPYALVRHGGRHFLRRFGDRTVPMSREEIFNEVNRNRTKPLSARAGGAPDKLKTDLDAVAGQEAARFWLGLELEGEGDLKLRALRETDLLADPTLSGIPRGGFDFTAAGYRGAPKIEANALAIGDADLSLRILRSGGVRFEASLAESFWVGRVPLVNAEKLLSPEALLGYPMSVVHLLGRLLGEPSLWNRPPEGEVWAGLGLTGLRGWGLLPGDLAEWPSYRYQIRRFEDRNLLVREPLRFTQDDFRQRPDECGRRLVERIYDAFEIDLLPSPSGATAPGHAGLPPVGPDGYSRWYRLDLGGGAFKPGRLRADNMRPRRFEWETPDGDLIPADGRWVKGWSEVE
jgi:hypothetical protein